MKKELLEKLRTRAENSSILSMSRESGIPYATLHRIIHETSGGTMRIWEKIAEYLKDKKL